MLFSSHRPNSGTRSRRAGLLAGLLLLASPTFAQAPRPETPDEFARRTAWWREAKFGMFIHWGVYAVPADSTTVKGDRGIAEWYFHNKQAQMADYEKFAPQFNPVKFDAADWVRTARNAGMKYMVITSKHHDGFCMFDTKLTDWSIMKATPFKRDPMRELAEECRKQGIQFCFYHSIMDWHHPDYLPRRPWEKDTRPASGAVYSRYVDYMKGQLRELVAQYDPAVLWFDGEWEDTWTHEMGKDLYGYVRGLKPEILINNRVDKGRAGMAGMTVSSDFLGDFGTPEQEVPATGFADGRLWESCMTMNDTWGYAANDTNWKSATQLIHTLCDIAHKGGNFLLNVGPMADGRFPDPINERLAEIGRWMSKNGEAIYGTTAGPFKRLPFDGRCTRKGDTLYLLVFNWPEEGLPLRGLKNRPAAVRALSDGQVLEWSSNPDGKGDAVIKRPAVIDPHATVVALKLSGEPEVEMVPLRPDPKGMLLLQARDADVHGHSARYEVGHGKDNIGFWTNKEDFVTWDVETRGGAYAVEIVYACPPENEGATFTIRPTGAPDPQPGAKPEGASVSGVVTATGSWTEFRSAKLSSLLVPPGRATISVRIDSLPKGAAMNLKEIRLTPVKGPPR